MIARLLDRLEVPSKRERWKGVRNIPETVDGYDWAPFLYIFRVYRWRGRIVWKKLLAERQLDQYELVNWALR